MRVLVVSADRSDGRGEPINIGDAFLTDAFIERLTSEGHEAVAADFGGAAQSTPPRDARVYVRGMSGLATAIREHDAVVVGGGTMIQEDSANLLSGSLMRPCAATALISGGYRKPLFYFGVGVDPTPRRLARVGYGAALAPAKAVWVRDEKSKDRITTLTSPKKVHLGADLALLANRPQVTPPGHRVLFAPNFEHTQQISPSLIERLSETTSGVSFLSMSRGTDLGDDRKLVPAAAAAMERVLIDGSTAAAEEMIASSETVVASRMHALYLAMLHNRPMVAVGTSPKVLSFASEFSIPVLASFGDYRHGVEKLADQVALQRARDRAEIAFAELMERFVS